MRRLLPALAVCLLAAAGAAAEAPLYTNAELVSVDVRSRVIVVRMNDGRSRAMRLEDAVSTAGLRPGDEVLLAVHDAPGSPRVSRILRSVAGVPVNRTPRGPAAATTTATSTGTPAREDAAAAAVGNPNPAPALEAFDRRVGALAQQAGYVDAVWSVFASSCAADVSGPYDRGWFSLWEAAGTVRPDLTSGYCRELYNQILARGQSVKAGMAAAEEQARTASLLPGDIRSVRRQHGMDWDGWGRPSPERLTP